MTCKKCGNNEEFWVIERMRNWVKINKDGEIVDDSGEVEENILEKEQYQCAVCDKVFYENYNGKLDF